MKKVKIIFLIFVIIVIIIVVVLFITKSANQGSSTLNIKKDIKREQNKEKIVKMDSNKNSSQQEKKYVEGQILVKFKVGLSQEGINKFLSDYGLKKMEIIQGINVYKLGLPPGKTVQDILKLIQKDQRIEYAEPNYLFKLNL